MRKKPVLRERRKTQPVFKSHSTDHPLCDDCVNQRPREGMSRLALPRGDQCCGCGRERYCRIILTASRGTLPNCRYYDPELVFPKLD